MNRRSPPARLLLSRVGWTQQEIADFLDVSQPTIISDVNFNISDNLSEDLLRDALEGLPDGRAETFQEGEEPPTEAGGPQNQSSRPWWRFWR